MFFDNIKTIDALKRAYRQMAREHHPDKGGDVEMMKAVNQEYETAFRRIHEEAFADLGSPSDFGVDVDAEWEVERIFIEKIRAVAHLEGITIELAGRWLWVTGNTYPVREVIKTAGFYWARKKRAWYWRPEDAKTRNQKELSLDEIRERHGSKVVKPNPVPSLRS